MTVSELNDLLLKHHENIEGKTNFIVDNAPPKLHEEIMANRSLMMPKQVVQSQSPPVPFPPQFAKVSEQPSVFISHPHPVNSSSLPQVNSPPFPQVNGSPPRVE